MQRTRTIAGLAGLTLGLLIGTSALAAVTAAQRRQVENLEPLINKAGRLFKARDYDECRTVVRELQEKLDALTANADKDLLAEVAPVFKRLQKAHALLELEGIPLPPLKKLPDAGSRPEVKSPAGKETVSFANDLAPLLDEHCAKCHGRERRAGGQLNLTTFGGLWRGGESGPPVQPGQPAESLLMQKLTGKADGEAMPLQAPPLADSVLKKFQTWIEEGATFDGPDAGQELGHFAELRKAKKMSHNELQNERLQLAQRNWAACTAGGKNDRCETRKLLLLGDVGPTTLQDDGKLGDWLGEKLGDLFGESSVQLIKGRATLYVFQDHAAAAAFARKLDGRDLPSTSPGYWRYTVVDAYAVVVRPQATEYSLGALLAQQLAALYVASLGSVPAWFAEGSARTAAAKIKADDARVMAWDAQLPKVIASMKRADDFLTGKFPEESAAIASYGFIKHLMKDSRRYLDVLDSVRQGKDFNAALSASFGGSTFQIAKDWVNEASK